MIVDTLKNAHLYYGMGENFAIALKYLKENHEKLADTPPGTYEIKGRDVYLLRKDYQSFPLAECKLENHRKYADIQLVLKGREMFGYCPLDRMKLYESHDDRDVYFHHGETADFVLEGDLFALFLSGDGHRPERAVNDIPEPIVKAVVKVKL